MVYREKIKSLDELRERGLIIIDEDKKEIENNILKILKQKQLTISDLSKLTGISRQNLNAIIKGKAIPGVNIALKISYVLNAPIDKLFTLTEDAWVKPFSNKQDYNLYLDVVNLEIVDNSIRKEFIKRTGYEYYNIEEKKYLTKKERDELLKEALKNGMDVSIFNKNIIKIFQKLGEKINPIIIY